VSSSSFRAHLASRDFGGHEAGELPHHLSLTRRGTMRLKQLSTLELIGLILCAPLLACGSAESTVEPVVASPSPVTFASSSRGPDSVLERQVHQEPDESTPAVLDGDDETRAEELEAPDAVEPDSFLVDFVDAPVSDVVLYMAEITGENIVYSGELKGRVTFHGARPVTREQAFEVFTIALEGSGYALEHRDDFYVVVPVR
jgi:hypothetical protein